MYPNANKFIIFQMIALSLHRTIRCVLYDMWDIIYVLRSATRTIWNIIMNFIRHSLQCIRTHIVCFRHYQCRSANIFCLLCMCVGYVDFSVSTRLVLKLIVNYWLSIVKNCNIKNATKICDVFVSLLLLQ